MAGFYEDMAGVARDLLAPDSAGGLGQGAVQIVRLTPGTVDPDKPWIPVTPSETVATVDQIRSVKAEYVERGTIITTDMAFMCTPASFEAKPGDMVRIAGVDVGTVVHVEPFGSLDVPVYVKVWANR